MARHKDTEWNLPERFPDWNHAQVALLMDLRDELKQLNQLLHRQNFIEIPRILRGIRRKLPTKVKKKRGRK